MMIVHGGQRYEIDAGKEPSSARRPTMGIEQVSAKQIERRIKKGEESFFLELGVSATGLEMKHTEIPDELGKQWKELLGTYGDVFPSDHPGYPPKRNVELGIDLEPGVEPVSRPVYKLSPAELDELKAQLTLLLEKGLIRPSKSPWGAPVLLSLIHI